MSRYRYNITEFESRAHLGNDEVQLLFHLMRVQPLTMEDATFNLRATESAMKLLFHSLNTKLQPLGYIVKETESGYVLQEKAVKNTVAPFGGSISFYD